MKNFGPEVGKNIPGTPRSANVDSPTNLIILLVIYTVENRLNEEYLSMSSADPGRSKDACLLSGSNFFHFHAVFRNILAK